MSNFLSLLMPLLLPSVALPVNEPKVVWRKAQPYVGIRTRATVDQMPMVLPRLLPKIFAFLERQGVEPAGPVLIRYRMINMEQSLEVEAGVPVAKPVKGSGEIFAELIPAGRYVSYLYTGRNLVRGNAQLQAWAKKKGLSFDFKEKGKSSWWTSRLEFYLTDPAEEPNPDKWQAEGRCMLKRKKGK